MNNKKKYLEDVAVKLFWSLHSSENENIISSLLTASLNESIVFKEWFLKAAGMHGKYDPSNFYATANVTIPEVLRGKKSAIRRYQHPDVFLLDSRRETAWDMLREGGGKDDLASALGNIRSIFVEVKHTDLSSEDREKYARFNECISGQCNENWVKFIIISSHTKPALARLKNKEWQELRESIGEEKHIILKDIYDAIKGLDKRKCKRCTILYVFESYLALSLGPTKLDESENGIFESYWKDIMADSEPERGNRRYSLLKREITEYVEWLVKINGFSGGQWNRYKKDGEIEKLETIILSRHNYKTSFRGKNGLVNKLEVYVDTQYFPFDLSFKQKSRTINNIVKHMADISQLISEYQGK